MSQEKCPECAGDHKMADYCEMACYLKLLYVHARDLVTYASNSIHYPEAVARRFNQILGYTEEAKWAIEAAVKEHLTEDGQTQFWLDLDVKEPKKPIKLPDDIKPYWWSNLPRCNESKCPSYDGKPGGLGCGRLGHQPGGICEPAVISMFKTLDTVPPEGCTVHT